MSTLGVIPIPNHRMNTGPIATAGIEYATRKYGSVIR